jgi:hypothetical protein
MNVSPFDKGAVHTIGRRLAHSLAVLGGNQAEDEMNFPENTFEKKFCVGIVLSYPKLEVTDAELVFAVCNVEFRFLGMHTQKRFENSRAGRA